MRRSRLKNKTFYIIEIGDGKGNWEKNTYETESFVVLQKYPEKEDDGMELLLPRKV